MVSVYCRCIINVLCLYFAQKPFSTMSRDACSVNSPVNQERLSVSTKPHEFEINNKNYAEKYPLGSQSRTDKFNQLQRDLAQQQSVFQLQRGKTEALNVASNIVSWEIVGHMKPFADGEFIKECMIKVSAQLFPDKADIQRAFKHIPLSARTVARRADMLSSNIEDQLDDDIR